MRYIWLVIFIFKVGALSAQFGKQALPDSVWLQGRWQASWISCPGTSLKDYGVFHFRRVFDLKDKPGSFVVNVSGDQRYRLFVNGVEVCNGPARGDLANWRFETIDIAEHLTEGKNVLAAVVWNFGEFTPLAQMSHQTAFILQGNTASEQIVNTGNNWKVYKNEAYQVPSKRPTRSVVGAGDEVDAALYPFGWEGTTFDDSTWLKPRSVGAGFPRGKFPQWDRMLVPRNIPFMEHRFQRIAEVERTENIVVSNDFLSGKSPVQIPAHQKVKILLDNVVLTTAYPVLKVSGGKGAKITIGYAEALVDQEGNKGNRNDVQGKVMDSDYHDIFKPDGGDDRVFQPLWYRTYRYMELRIETADSPLMLNDIHAYFRAYPLEEKGYFRSDNPTLSSIWDMGWRTARLCAGEIYYDCPYYEQLQYLGDTRIQALISLYVSGDDRLVRNAIEQFRHSLLPDGLTQSRYPSSQPQVIPTFSLFWVAMIHDFWMHRDDESFVKEQLGGVKNVLAWYERQVDHTGILGPMDWWNFVDWSFGKWNPVKPLGGVPPGGMDGHSAIISLQYAYTLQMAAQLFRNFGEPELAAKYENQAKSLMEKTYALCWSAEKGLLADTPAKIAFSQHANIMGLLAGAFDNRQQPQQVMKNLLAAQDIVSSTYYFRFYLHRALEKAGMSEDYLQHLYPWEEMLKNGLTTCAERPEPTRSDCHAWSAAPNYDFLSLVSGIKPASPGFKTVRIAPHLGTLTHIEASMPHPYGAIKMNLKRKGKKGVSGTIELPDNLSGVFEWEGKTIHLTPGIRKIEI
ncbi:alpha-L-rhamnosidase [Parapedobacter sp. SGR-10]|uniref:alpha-L-rhamnosidase-related protein n=1 Tax=Parapedobacter sp. SGR-10 TaxID=2710879 RepID=UPI0013D0AE85|nr:alpha-L-rhamnosidase C-terminal domain-containing protein [Parapedobacter sp. SGR-10]NGF56442.1 alpha-L-rhamnosidase [Parapedobacter sp. SGR-10]